MNYIRLAFISGLWTLGSGLIIAQDVDTLALDKMMALREVVVKGNLPHTRLKGNSMITRVEGTALASSGTVGEMLVKVPGMTGTEDALEVLGKGTPVVYINGRMVRDMSELKRLRSEDVRDVEVINNPGALYDATVKAVVRIRTKKIQGEGLGFDLVASDDQDLRYNFNKPNVKLNANYRKNGVDLFGGVWYYHQDYRQYSWLEETTLANKVFQQSGPYTMTWKNDVLTYTGGANWQISENHSVGVRADLTHFLGGENKVIYDEDVCLDGVFTDHLYSEQTSKEEQPLGLLTNAYYNGTVGKLGIDFNFDFMSSGTDTDRDNQETGLTENEVVLSKTGTDSKLYATKLVLSYPIWKGEIEAGTEMTFVNRHNTYWIDKASIANSDADVKENNIAVFAEYGADFGKVGKASAGLRYEHTLFDYDDHLGTDNLHRIDDEFFPYASYSNSFGNVQMSLSYSMKTNRPSFFALNDAVTYISRYSMQAGNSQLRNERVHELTFNSSWKWLTFTASYERQKNAISQWAYLEPGDAVLIRHFNIDHPINIYSAYIGATPHIGIWSLNATAGVQKQDFYLDLQNPDGTIRRERFEDPIATVNAFNTFSLHHDWRVDLNLMFTSCGHQQNFYNDYNICRLGVVVQKTLLRDKSLTLRAGVTDILQRYRYNEYGDMGFYKIQQNNRYSQHKLNLTVMYRFNSARSKYRGTGAGKEAQERMKN